MIIDAHTHIFPDSLAARAVGSLAENANLHPHTDGSAASLLASMDRAGIGLSIVLPVATKPSQVAKINESAAAINERFPGRLLSLGTIHPDCGDYREQLRRVKDLGLAGIKVHPVFHHTDLDDAKYLRIFDEAASLGLAAVTHAGYDIGFPGEDRASPRMARHVVEEIGSFPFVLAHMGGWGRWEEVCGLLADTGVYLDCAFCLGTPTPLADTPLPPPRMLDEALFMEILRAFGPRRILFGSDSPWSGQAASLERILALPLGTEEKSMILGENARRLFGIPG